MSSHEKDLLKYLGTHLVYGLAAGLTFGVAVLATNLGNLRTLVWESNHTLLVLVLFFFGLFITFGSVGMGVGVMSMPRDEDELE